jgi:hypothetical protein
VLTVAHIPVPDVLAELDTAAGGALFGITLPARVVAAATTPAADASETP